MYGNLILYKRGSMLNIKQDIKIFSIHMHEDVFSFRIQHAKSLKMFNSTNHNIQISTEFLNMPKIYTYIFEQKNVTMIKITI